MSTKLRKSSGSLFPFLLSAGLFFYAALFSFPAAAHAEDATTLNDKLQATKQGDISVADFAAFLLVEAEAGELTVPFIGQAFSEVPDLPHTVAGLLPAKVSAALASGSTGDARGLRMLAEGLEGTEPGVSLKTVRLFELAEKADALLAQGKAEDLLQLESSVSQPAEKAIVGPRLAKVSASVDRDLQSAENPFVALGKLVQVKKAFTSDKLNLTIESLVQSVDKGMESGKLDMSAWTLDNPDIVELVRLASQSRPALKPVLARIYQRHLFDLMASDTLKGLSETYSALLENRPDPSKENDDLRLKIVLDAKTDSMREFASGRLEELRYSGALSKVDNLRVMLHGYYGYKVPIFFGVSILIIVLFGVLMMIRPFFISKVATVVEEASSRKAQTTTIKKPPPAAETPMTPDAQLRAKEEARLRFEQELEEEERDKKRLFKKRKKKKEKYVPGYMRDPEDQDDEYTKLLAFFGLDDSATEAQIKKAYREKVKNLHPDSKPGEVDTQDQDFIDLKEVYDRLLEVRKSWFGKR